jgi:symplekin
LIKSVQTYKSLVPFVSTSLLSRLITKKVWLSPQLWEGFIRCARVMGMASYGALLQLPREQLKEIVNRPDGKLIKTGLRDFVLKRAGGNATKLPSWFGEVFPTEPSPAPDQPIAAAVSPVPPVPASATPPPPMS